MTRNIAGNEERNVGEDSEEHRQSGAQATIGFPVMIHKTFPLIYLKQKEVLRWTFPLVVPDRKQFSVVPALQLPCQVEN